MNATIEKTRDFKELSLFLSNINKQKSSHIGYCGEKAEEIYATLEEDFGDSNFVIARGGSGEIVAALGFDIDETSAEVWGPFNVTSSVELQHEIWGRLVSENPEIETFHFFINNENTQQQHFMNEIGAIKTGEHLILEVKEENFEKVTEMKSKPFTQSDFHSFEKLHNEAFPNTYYDARTIVERLGNGNILKVLKNEELEGYAYFEIDTEMSEASLEYISISQAAQNRGLGTMMLREALTEMFSYPEIREIKLVVENTNSKANHVYLKAGFAQKDILSSYLLTR